MVDQPPIERRLRENRYRTAAESCTRVLDGLGVDEGQRRVLQIDEVDELWPRYLSRLRDGDDASATWPVERFADVQRHVELVRSATAGMNVVWFAYMDSEPVGIEAPSETLLGAGLSYLVSPAADLMLTTKDVANGICIEQNHLAEGDEYEVVGWGLFSP